jgi:hypothetical protein
MERTTFRTGNRKRVSPYQDAPGHSRNDCMAERHVYVTITHRSNESLADTHTVLLIASFDICWAVLTLDPWIRA